MALIFQSLRMQQVLEQARRFARSSATVLICGESGSGKELLARMIHQHSPRRDAPYIRINCAALSESLVESELFGHEAGAFTGAVQRRRGRCEEAANGTLFLDEVGELSSRVQAKLLRVLEEREFQRVGGNDTLPFTGRVVAATNRNLSTEVQQGRFRPDLFYRLNILTLSVPPLRERREDIPALANFFLKQCQPELDRPVRGVTRDVMHRLCEYSWPGNVRELRNVMLRLCILSPTEIIERVEFVEFPQATEPVVAPDVPLDVPQPFDRLTLAEIERQVILLRLQQHHGNREEVAQALGVTARTLRNKVQQYRKLGYAC